MTPGRALLDTDVLSALMRRDARAVGAAGDYLRVHGRLTFSLVTRFEVLRGLEAKSATSQRRAFDRLCVACEVLPISDEVIEKAAAVYGDLHRAGRLIPDADMLISATALVHDIPVVTNNTGHFARVPGLQLLNWLAG